MALSFAAHLDVLPVDDRGLVTVGEHGCDIYSGRPFAKLPGLIDGSRDEPDILAACDEVEREALAAAIVDLRRAGVLVEAGREIGSSADAAWWAGQRVPAATATRRIRAASVRVQALGDLDVAPTLAALGDAGVQVSDRAELGLVLVGDYLDDGLSEINAHALSQARSWMLAAPGGAQILVGPVFVPDAGPCWECLAQRMWLLRGLERELRGFAGRDGSARLRPAPRSARSLGPSLLATELTRWLAGARPGLESLILSFDARSWEGARHHVTWRPQCPACGEAQPPLECRAAPVHLRAASTSDDHVSLRDAAPEVTIRRYEHHLSPISGAVQTLHRIPGADPMHVYIAGGPSARVHGPRAGWEGFDRQPAGGKGTSDAVARASALCEALERYSGAFGGEEPRRTATFRELGELAIHPNDYMRFSDRQYAQRARYDQHDGPYRAWVPEPFDPGEPIEWSPCWSLTHERERLAPTALLYYGADPPGTRFCVAESNGNAAGNTLEEAILHGLLELVERDQVAVWWYNRLSAPVVQLDTLADPWLERLRAQLAEQGRELWALDLTADLGIPVAVALASSAQGDRVGIGFGAHIDLRRAVIRATTELVQLGLGAPSGGLGTGPDDLTLERFPFLKPAAARTVAAGPERDDGLIEALQSCRGAVERQGIEVLVCDQTRPDIGLPVVKVIAPGLRHFWTRFGPGRLYDVPVAMGRLDRPHTEEELTPRAPSS